MTGINHGITGAVIALVAKEPALALPASFASHFVCDAIPHYGVPDEALFTPKFNRMLAADFLLSVSLMVLLGAIFPEHKWLIWVCMVLAAIPDAMWAYYYLYIQHIKRRPMHFDPLAKLHSFVQWSQTKAGASVELLWFVLMAVILVTIKVR